MKLIFAAGLFAALTSLAPVCSAALFDREIAISEAEVQSALVKSGPQEKNYGWMRVALLDPPHITLGSPAERIGVAARLHISLLGNPPIPVDITGTAGLRYDDKAKAFFLDRPVAHRVESQAIPKEAEPGVRQTANTLIANYFRGKPVYVLREDGSPQEIAVRWLLRSIRIEPGKVVATLSPL